MCALAPFIAAFYSNYPAGTLTGLVMAISLRATADASGIVPLSRLRGALLYRSIALIDGTAQLAATLATVVLALNGAGAMSLVLPQVLAAAAKAMAYAWACSRSGRQNPRHRTRSRLYPRIRADFFTASIAQYVHNVVVLLEILVLGLVSGELQTGLFGFAFLLAAQANGVIAYQLAVVVDDAEQGITDVVRGADLWQATAWQLGLQQALGLATPRYLHLPVVTEPDGQKLAKARRSIAIETGDSELVATLRNVLALLRQDAAPEAARTPKEILEFAAAKWNTGRFRGLHSVMAG
jgi:hypothetical protein